MIAQITYNTEDDRMYIGTRAIRCGDSYKAHIYDEKKKKMVFVEVCFEMTFHGRWYLVEYPEIDVIGVWADNGRY